MGRILSMSWGNGAQNYICRHPVRRLWQVFLLVLNTPLIVMFQTYSDDINITVPPISSHIL